MPAKLAEEARFDGIFVLRTNAKITPLQAVLRYRDLLKVENLFLRTKAVMRTRPIFHSSDAAIRGHVFCSFLALSMQKYLEDLSRRAGVIPEWKTLLRDLDRLQHVRIRHRDNDWLVRTDVSEPIADLFHHGIMARLRSQTLNIARANGVTNIANALWAAALDPDISLSYTGL